MSWISYLVISIFTLLISIFSVYFFQFYKKKTEMDIEGEGNNRDNEKEEVKEKDKMDINIPYIVVMFVMNIFLANFITFLYKESLLINIKLMSLVVFLWPIAYIDYRKKIIPNSILKIMLVLRVFFLIPEMIVFDDRGHILFSMLIAALAMLVACMICGLIMKGAIGMGDVKLFLIMALFLGLEGIWSAVFCSLIVSFCVAVFSLITKRVKRKDNIPFAPSILIGTYLSIFLTGI